MNPHRLAWGFATTISFAWAIGIATVIGALFSKEPKHLKGGIATFVLALFVVYMLFTTSFALVPDRAWPMLERAIKVQVGTLLALVLLYRKDHVLALMWVIAGSIGFYAIKGGIFTIATLGQYRVWGPEDSFIADNNAFGLATVMSIPLWAYLYTQYRERPWIRVAVIAAVLLSAVSAIGSHSRGAVVAIVAMAVFLWLKSKRKLALGAFILIAAISAVAFMPEEWEERISTITDPRAEQSANSRLETWTMLWNLAADRPLTGGGFETYQRWIFEKYNPGYDRTHAAHSIYFQVLGEHGFLALGLFLLFWALVWRMCSQVAAMSRNKPDEHWAFWLAQMLKGQHGGLPCRWCVSEPRLLGRPILSVRRDRSHSMVTEPCARHSHGSRGRGDENGGISFHSRIRIRLDEASVATGQSSLPTQSASKRSRRFTPCQQQPSQLRKTSSWPSSARSTAARLPWAGAPGCG